MMMFKVAVCLCLATVAFARSAPTVSGQEARSAIGSTLFNDMKYVYNLYQGCASQDLLVCLKVRLLTTMDRVSRSAKDVSITDNLKVVNERVDVQNAADQEPALTEEVIEQSLPRSLQAQDQTLNSMLLKKFLGMIKNYSFQVNFAEGRGKEDKKNGWVMIPVILAGSFVPLAYGALALLAGKALIVSKLALVLASIIGIKKLVSSSAGHHEASHEVVVSGGHGGSGWGRQLNSQNLAYSAHAKN